MTPEQKQTLNVLESLARTMDSEQIERRLLDAGYFRASEDERTKHASLVDIAKADVGETKWHEREGYAYKISLKANVKRYEQYEFVWLHVLRDNGKGVGVPFIERIFARAV